MKYWLLSQNALSVQYTEKLLKSSLEEENFNIYMWNWNFNTIEKPEDINEKNLAFPNRLDWRYSIIQFYREMSIWDKIILIQNKKQIYGIWEIIWDLEVIKHNWQEIIKWDDKTIFSRQIKWLFKAKDWYFTFDEKDKITQFRRTLAEISEIDYNNIKLIVENLEKNKNYQQGEFKEETYFDVENIEKNEVITDITDTFDIELVKILNWKTFDMLHDDDDIVLDEKKLNALLPIFRIELIRSLRWKLISNKIDLWISEKLKELIDSFDNILDKKQARDDKVKENLQKMEQRENIFKKLTMFFICETIWLAIIIILVWVWFLNISDTTLQVLTWATILQVWAMLTIVTKYLFPNN